MEKEVNILIIETKGAAAQEFSLQNYKPSLWLFAIDTRWTDGGSWLPGKTKISRPIISLECWAMAIKMGSRISDPKIK